MINYIKVWLIISIIIIGVNSCSRKNIGIFIPPLQPEGRELPKQPNVALVLGGGAFHGMAHVGVIKVLEDNGIPIDLIVGTSAGSVVGVLYADLPNIDSLLPLMNATTTKDIFDFSLFRSNKSLVSGKRLQKYLFDNLGVTEIEKTKIPFVAVVTDIEKGTTVALKAGPIAPSVNASCAIPGIFEPVEMYGTTFIDGGILDNVPVDIAKEYQPKYIIAVDIMKLKDTVQLNSYNSILKRTLSIMIHNLTDDRLVQADIIITPDLKGIPYMKSDDNEKLYQLGIEAANKALSEIKKELESRGIKLQEKELPYP